MAAYDMGGLFAPPPLMGGGHQIWQVGPLNPLTPSPISNGHHNGSGGQFGNQGLSSMASLLVGPGGFPAQSGSMSTMPDLTPKAETINGYGQLTWLSSKAGLITCKNKMVISFQIKDFCDQHLTDLTSVLRVGFTLSFQASLSETNEYIATLVSPLYGQESETIFGRGGEVNLEDTSPAPPNSKDAYSCSQEGKAVPALLAIFQRHSMPQIQLSSMHSQMSSCGDEDLFRYVGSSSLKRRQFVERRTHLFRLTSDDMIALQPPWVFACVHRLASRLLCRGGATAIQSLYEYYLSPEMPSDIRECIGDGRSEFLALIQGHTWIFALFPNRTYVSARRNLPHFDYTQWIKQTFPDNDLFRPPSTHSQQFGAARGVMRSMSHQPLSSSHAPSRHGSSGAPQPNASRPHNLWGETSVHTGLSSPVESQWSPLLGSSTTWRPSPVPSTNSLLQTSTPTHAQKVLVSASTQTDSSIQLGESGCVCSCNCGRRRVIGSRSSGGSASPPSLESASPLSHEISSAGPGSPTPPMRYYDPFGFDMKTTFNNLHI